MRQRQPSTAGFPVSVVAEPAAVRRVNRRSLAWAMLAATAVALGALASTMAGTSGPARRGIGSSLGRQVPTRRLSSLPLAAQGSISAALGGDDPAYLVRGGNDQLRTFNNAQHLRVSFTRSGVLVSAAGARLGLALRAAGYGTSLHGVGAASPSAHGNRVVYARGTLREWYANGPLGLEQGFSVQHQLATHPTGPLTLSLAQSGNLHAVLAHDGRGVLFDADGGRTLLRYDGLMASDARGHKLQAWLSLQGSRILVHVDTRGARYPLRIDPIVQNAELTATDGAENSALGYSVAVSGTTIAVGAEGQTVKGDTLQGAVYVFSEPASGGYVNATQTAELTASDGAKNDGLGFSVAMSGSTIVAGGWLHSVEGHAYQGAVYVFSKPSTGPWVNATQTAELTAKDGETFDELGFSVAVSGSTIVAGARYHTVNGHAKQGAVYVFSRPSSGPWVNATQTAELTASDGAAVDYLGTSVAVSGSTIVAGSELHTVSGHAEQGAVYVFSEPSTGGWVNATQTAELTAGDGAEDDELGYSVALSGTTIAAGAPGRLVNSHARQGAVYVFSEPASGDWVNATQTAELTANDGAEEDELGTSVAVSGSTIVAGAPHDFSLGLAGPGAVYVFAEPPAGPWVNATQTAELNASADDSLGFKVGISGATIVAGAPFLTVGGHIDQGVAYVYDSPLPSAVITTPIEEAVYTQGQAVSAEFACTPGAGETLKANAAGCSGSVENGAAIDTSAPGTYTFTVTATDTDGQTGTSTSSYTVTPGTTITEPTPETTPSSTPPTTSPTTTTSTTPTTTTTTTPTTTTGVASTPKAIEELRLGCTNAQLVLNDVYIQGGHVEIRGSAAHSLVGKKVKILFNEGKQVATTTVEADGQYTTAAPLPPAKIRDSLTTRYTAEIGKLRSLHLKLVRRLLLEPPKASGTTVTLTGQLTLPLTKPIAPVVVEQQLECGKTTIAKTFTPSANGRFHITLTVPANAKAGIFRLTSKVAANKHSVMHGFTTFSLPLPVALG